MNPGKWYSKRAVMKDLTRATGINHFNENRFLIGERPPPSRRVEDDVQEIYERDGVPPNFSNKFEKPDLDGITQMLRMVDKYDEKPEAIDKTNVEKENDMKNIITISKLNPEVDEFLPANNIVAEEVLKNKFVNDPPHSNGKLKCNDKFIVQNDTMCNEHPKTLHKNAVPVNNNVNIEQIKVKLKTKISNTSNTSCFKAKRERNLAIATLLKLHSQAASSVSTKNDVKSETVQYLTSDAPLKLMSPNYFEKSLSVGERNEVTNGTENNNIILNKNVNEIAIEKNSNDMLIISNTNDTVSNTAKTIRKNKEGTKDNDDVNSTEWSESIYEDSVAKVTKWLESNSNKAKQDPSSDNLKDCEIDQQESLPIHPTSSIKSTQTKLNRPSQEGPSIYLGQVTFRKKEGPKSNSPSLSVSDKTARQTPSNAYIPSDYANELSKMYTERANARNDLPGAIWTNLEKKLKAKDEIIRQQTEERKKKQNSNSNVDQTS